MVHLFLHTLSGGYRSTEASVDVVHLSSQELCCRSRSIGIPTKVLVFLEASTSITENPFKSILSTSRAANRLDVEQTGCFPAAF
ncbi:hypothetical protein Hanom_Chr15g01337731 [Helianthus anomalus]